MQCFQLKDAQIIRGFPVRTREPHLVFSSAGDLHGCFSRGYSNLLAEAPEDYSSLRVAHIEVHQDGETFKPSLRESDEAIVLLDITAGPGGKVFLSAANDRAEKAVGRKIVPDFGPFPSLGISAWPPGTYDRGKEPWQVGAERIEQPIVMMDGASFRIYRTVPLKGGPVTSFVTWRKRGLSMTNMHDEKKNAPMRSSLLQTEMR